MVKIWQVKKPLELSQSGDHKMAQRPPHRAVQGSPRPHIWMEIQSIAKKQTSLGHCPVSLGMETGVEPAPTPGTATGCPQLSQGFSQHPACFKATGTETTMRAMVTSPARESIPRASTSSRGFCGSCGLSKSGRNVHCV